MSTAAANNADSNVAYQSLLLHSADDDDDDDDMSRDRPIDRKRHKKE